MTSALDNYTPAYIGDYDIIGLLGRGGMGVIYRAKQRSIGRVVALKVILAGELATPEECRRFRAEIETAATLDHPHIVPIYEVGEHDGRPYYTMKVYDGALADQLDRYREPAAAAALVAAVARAVHHGHQRGVLHRDLKPANILIDEHGRPHVGDFGTAKRVGDPATTEPGMLIGTPAYMAPEQARGGEQSVTTAVDVYSLGVVLYELITGTLPFAGDFASLMCALLEDDPVPPRQRAPAVPRELEAICLKCIEKQPAARYHTAEELADDLERFMRGDPVGARPTSFADRVWRFTQRRWLAVGAGVGTLLLLVVIAVTSISVARAQESELERDTLRTNGYAARNLARGIALQLHDRCDAVVDAAADPNIVRLLQDHSRDNGALEKWRKDWKQPSIDSISVFEPSGAELTRSPPKPRGQLGLDYSWRDYFIGAGRLGKDGKRAGYVSLAFLSEADGRYKFGVAAPVYDGNTWLGVLMATFGTDSSLGSMVLDDERSGRTVVLVALLDRSRANPNAADKYVIVRHDQLEHGTGVTLDSPRLRPLEMPRKERNQLQWTDPPVLVTDDDYRDPVRGFEGRWLAGFAPVGNTGFTVIVQTRYDAAVAPKARLWHRLVLRVGIAFLTWSLVFGAGAWVYARRRRRTLAARHLPGAVSATAETLIGQPSHDRR